MLMKFPKVLTLFVIAALLLTVSAGAVSAQEVMSIPGDSPGNAVTPAQGTVTIAPGQWQWYTFRSQATAKAKDDDDKVVTEASNAIVDAVVRLQTGKVDFEVWSSADLNKWINDEEFTPTGKGTKNTALLGEPITWQGSFETNETYYLIVRNRTAQPADYALKISGNVRFPSALSLSPAAQPAQAAVAQTQPVESTGEMALTVDLPGEAAMGDSTMMTKIASNVGAPAMPAPTYVTIAPGEKQWYSFRSQVPVNLEEKKVKENKDGDEVEVVTDPNRATIDAVLRTQAGAVDFEVWSSDNLNSWRNAEEFNPMGAGTKNESLTGDPLSWQGMFKTNQTYYLVVTNRSSQPVSYRLDISGDVSFPATGQIAQ